MVCRRPWPWPEWQCKLTDVCSVWRRKLPLTDLCQFTGRIDNTSTDLSPSSPQLTSLFTCVPNGTILPTLHFFWPGPIGLFSKAVNCRSREPFGTHFSSHLNQPSPLSPVCPFQHSFNKRELMKTKSQPSTPFPPQPNSQLNQSNLT